MKIWSTRTNSDFPHLHFAHATGFSALTYLDLFRRLNDRMNIDAWDMRGHGINRALATDVLYGGWETYYRDLCSFLATHHKPVWLAGHSIGATVSLAAARRYPEKVHGLILCDPVILPLKQRAMLQFAKWVGRSQSFGLAKGAKLRRHRFASQDEAWQNFRNKKAFGSWPDQWLRNYVASAFHEASTGIEISCPPDWESLTFGHTEVSPWRHIEDIGKPIIVLAGESGSTFPSSEHRRFIDRVKHSEIRVLPGTTHFLPMEKPELVAEVILSTVFPEQVLLQTGTPHQNIAR